MRLLFAVMSFLATLSMFGEADVVVSGGGGACTACGCSMVYTGTQNEVKQYRCECGSNDKAKCVVDHNGNASRSSNRNSSSTPNSGGKMIPTRGLQGGTNSTGRKQSTH